MKKASKGSKKPAPEEDDILPEYDFSGGVRGKYAERFAAGSNFFVIDPELAAKFPDSESVEKALRAYLKSKIQETLGLV